MRDIRPFSNRLIDLSTQQVFLTETLSQIPFSTLLRWLQYLFEGFDLDLDSPSLIHYLEYIS